MHALGPSFWRFVDTYKTHEFKGWGIGSEPFTSSAGDNARGPGRSPTQESRRVAYSAALT
jgi:hypothetical protein